MTKIHPIAKTIIFTCFVIIVGSYTRAKIKSNRPTYSFISGDEYVAVKINGVIDSIYKYDRGDPIVLINHERVELSLTSGCREYLSVNDSVVKLNDTQDIKTFRNYGSYTECIYWSLDGSDMNGVVSKVKIKNH